MQSQYSHIQCQETSKANRCYFKQCRSSEPTAPFAVRSNECPPVPSSELTPATLDGSSLSRMGPMRLHICNKWSGAMCLFAATFMTTNTRN